MCATGRLRFVWKSESVGLQARSHLAKIAATCQFLRADLVVLGRQASIHLGSVDSATRMHTALSQRCIVADATAHSATHSLVAAPSQSKIILQHTLQTTTTTRTTQQHNKHKPRARIPHQSRCCWPPVGSFSLLPAHHPHRSPAKIASAI
jgi:hypothetical protein